LQDQSTQLFTLFVEIGKINQLSRALMDARLPGEMISTHFSVLNHLVQVQDGRTPLDLARAFQVPKTSMTHTLSGLDKAGFVITKSNPADGRSKLVWITEKGRRFRQDAIFDLVPQVQHLLSEIDVSKLEETIAYLATVRRVLDNNRV